MKYALFTAVAFVLVSFPVHAQTTVVTQPGVVLNDTHQSNIVVRERRNGAKIESAQIDICYQTTPNGAFDRAVFEMKPEGNEITGTGVSHYKKTPVSFRYSSAYQNDSLTYKGIVKIGAQETSFTSSYVSEMTEKEYQEGIHRLPLMEKPNDFTVVSPQWVAIRTKVGTMPALIEYLRGQNVVLDSVSGLVEDCDALRAGSQAIQFIVHPERAEAVMAGARKLPGVIAAGWGGYSNMIYGIRLDAAVWSEGGKPARKKIETALAKAIAQAVGGEFVSAASDPRTGDLTLNFTRKSQFFPGLGFIDKIEVIALAEYERPVKADHVVVWINSLRAVLADEGAGARLQFRTLQELGGEGLYIDAEPVVEAIAREMKGKTWNTVDERWN